MSAVDQAVADGVLPGRVWLYSNYHCNLTCSYCLTESGPGVQRRELSPARMVEVAEQAADLGFTDLGLTGGEPFLLPTMPETLARLGAVLPTVALTNGTLFTGRRLAAAEVLAGARVALQISLDSAEPDDNDRARGPENFAKVVAAVPALVERGITVRIATTQSEDEPADMARLCALHRDLGVPDSDHVVRPIIARGRAEAAGLGVEVRPEDLPAELTVTADGAFWSPFGPTVRGGRLDTDLLLTRTTDPLQVPAQTLLGLIEGRPPGADSTLNIR
ncbi:MAG: radical SAM protein [Geodermatophilaceae bacterium]|nr:radical SAM protein [Geodermatophilaceae bacterium]MDQ3455924.1 radical SAM protein [Actinomycetota bacterium]